MLNSQKYVQRRYQRNPEDRTTKTVQSERKIVGEKRPEDRILWTDPQGQPIKTVTQSRQSSQCQTNQIASITTVIATSGESDSIHHDGHCNIGQII